MTAFNLPAGILPGMLPGNRRSDDENERILEAFDADVRKALEDVPGITDGMLQSVLDLLTEEYGDDVIERRRFDPEDER